MEKITINWNDHLEALDCEFECGLKDEIYEKKGFRVDGQGENGFINKIKFCFNNQTPSSCDYFYCTHSKKLEEEIFCCIEFSDLDTQYKDLEKGRKYLWKTNKGSNGEDKKYATKILKKPILELIILQEINKKITSTQDILKHLYENGSIVLQNFPLKGLPKYFFIILNLLDETGRFPDYLSSKIQNSTPFHQGVFLMDAKEFYENYCQ